MQKERVIFAIAVIKFNDNGHGFSILYKIFIINISS